MKVKDILEARLATAKVPVWVEDMDKLARMRNNSWKTLIAPWAKKHIKLLSKLWDNVVDDRDGFLDQYEDPDEEVDRFDEPTDEVRLVGAELWASAVSPEDYPMYKELIKRHDENVVDAVVNLMIDSAGGLRDEDSRGY